MSDSEKKALIKEAAKEAIKEWIDERYQEFGRWSFRAIMAAALGLLGYLILTMNGWHK